MAPNLVAASARRTLVVVLPLLLGARHAVIAQVVDVGDSLPIRFVDPVAAGNLAAIVRARTIAPVIRGGGVVIPPGAILVGKVDSAGIDERAREHWLSVHFESLTMPSGNADSLRVPISARVAVLDNTREIVDTSGRIVGPSSPSFVRSRRGWALMVLGSVHPVAAIAMAAVLEAETRERHRSIALPSGTEGIAVMTRRAILPAGPVWLPPPAIALDSALSRTIQELPRRSLMRDGRRPGDVFTLAFLGTREAVRAAFLSAGWDSSGTVSIRTDFLTFAKAARAKGYAHQPVSANVLDGRLPSFVFQKVANTFVKRHHIRIWESTMTWRGEPIWIAAASRDIGVEFSTARRTFAHTVDPRIDLLRDKIVNDLVAAGCVAEMGFVALTPLADVAVNDGASLVITDWRLGLIRLLR